ncbi:hypothetical protein [Streptomyces sp. CB03911]|uniref:hypothetical protein n=1 Tax=Streptomyces sp. CB03911 TaxID=1804758 RepID=UPI0018FE0953|nr:hypothetical protein [Streptomyces sp. CB03911]
MTVIDKRDRDYRRTGKVFYVLSDGDVQVDFGGLFFNALCGVPRFRPDQLQATAS